MGLRLSPIKLPYFARARAYVVGLLVGFAPGGELRMDPQHDQELRWQDLPVIPGFRLAQGGQRRMAQLLRHELGDDGPVVAQLVPEELRHPPLASLRKAETWYYRQILPPELLIVLRVHPELAARRKTNEETNYV